MGVGEEAARERREGKGQGRGCGGISQKGGMYWEGEQRSESARQNDHEMKAFGLLSKGLGRTSQQGVVHIAPSLGCAVLRLSNRPCTSGKPTPMKQSAGAVAMTIRSILHAS